jgi:hypothetical protein
VNDATRSSVEAFVAGDVSRWAGLPSGLTLDELEPVLNLARDVTGRGRLGSGRREASWVAAESPVYEGGLRVWLSGAEVVLLEGDDPFDADGEPYRSPDLGVPEATLDTTLEELTLRGGELVYAERGLALRTNPGNSILLGVRGFTSTTADEYVARLRPFVPPPRTLPEPVGHGGSW